MSKKICPECGEEICGQGFISLRGPIQEVCDDCHYRELLENQYQIFPHKWDKVLCVSHECTLCLSLGSDSARFPCGYCNQRVEPVRCYFREA